MCSWNRTGIWLLHIRSGRTRLCLPLPLYVLTDALFSLRDLCALILPRFGLPNYAAVLYEALMAIGEMREAPLMDIETNGVRVYAKRVA